MTTHEPRKEELAVRYLAEALGEEHYLCPLDYMMDAGLSDLLRAWQQKRCTPPACAGAETARAECWRTWARWRAEVEDEATEAKESEQ